MGSTKRAERNQTNEINHTAKNRNATEPKTMKKTVNNETCGHGFHTSLQRPVHNRFENVKKAEKNSNMKFISLMVREVPIITLNEYQILHQHFIRFFNEVNELIESFFLLRRFQFNSIQFPNQMKRFFEIEKLRCCRDEQSLFVMISI